MKKFLLAYNPVSGDAMFKKKLDDIINQFQSRDCIIMPYRTKKESFDPFFANCVRNVNADGIIAAGGDGTLHKIINMTLKENLDVPVGVHLTILLLILVLMLNLMNISIVSSLEKLNM